MVHPAQAADGESSPADGNPATRGDPRQAVVIRGVAGIGALAAVAGVSLQDRRLEAVEVQRQLDPRLARNLPAGRRLARLRRLEPHLRGAAGLCHRPVVKPDVKWDGLGAGQPGRAALQAFVGVMLPPGHICQRQMCHVDLVGGPV